MDLIWAKLIAQMKNTWPEKVHTLRFIAKYSFSRDRVFTTLLELYSYAFTHFWLYMFFVYGTFWIMKNWFQKDQEWKGNRMCNYIVYQNYRPTWGYLISRVVHFSVQKLCGSEFAFPRSTSFIECYAAYYLYAEHRLRWFCNLKWSV